MAKLYVFNVDDKCGGCNWRVTTLYVVASTKEDAKKFLKEHGGLCGDCMCEFISEEFELVPILGN